jgi:hypothetical protein
MSAYTEKLEVERAAPRRRAEDLAIAVDLLIRYVAPIDDLVRVLAGSGVNVKLVNALRAELKKRRARR